MTAIGRILKTASKTFHNDMKGIFGKKLKTDVKDMENDQSLTRVY